MKLLYATTLFAIVALKGVYGWKAVREVSRDEEGRRLTSYSQLYADIQEDFTACLIVKDSDARDDKKLILGDCGLPNQAWRRDADGLWHTKLNEDYCMQAGRGGKVGHGTKMRLFKCDNGEKRQQFVGPDGGIGGIKFKDPDYDDFCVEFRGNTPNINVDPIIVKTCDVSVAGWSAD